MFEPNIIGCSAMSEGTVANAMRLMVMGPGSAFVAILARGLLVLLLEQHVEIFRAGDADELGNSGDGRSVSRKSCTPSPIAFCVFLVEVSVETTCGNAVPKHFDAYSNA